MRASYKRLIKFTLIVLVGSLALFAIWILFDQSNLNVIYLVFVVVGFIYESESDPDQIQYSLIRSLKRRSDLIF